MNYNYFMCPIIKQNITCQLRCKLSTFTKIRIQLDGQTDRPTDRRNKVIHIFQLCCKLFKKIRLYKKAVRTRKQIKPKRKQNKIFLFIRNFKK